MESTTYAKRNGTLDILKFFMAAIVVFTHSACNFVPPNSLCYALRWSNLHFMWTFPAVETFACISAYFTFKTCYSDVLGDIEVSKLPKFIWRYVKLYFLWSILYVPDLIKAWKEQTNVKDALIGLLKSIFLSGTAPQMWYLLALIYSLLIIFALKPYIKTAGIVILSLAFYIFSMLGSSYFHISEIMGINSQVFALWQFFNHLFLFRIPFVVTLGLLLVYIEKKQFSDKKWLVSLGSIAFYLIMVGAQFVERKFTAANNMGFEYPAYFFTPFVAIGLLTVILLLPIRGNKFTLLLSEASSIIYFSHWFFKEIYESTHEGYCGYAFFGEMLILGICIAIAFYWVRLLFKRIFTNA